jgi:hypothetical protein
MTANTPIHPQDTEAGFSLIEVLAALIVTMLLVLALTPFTGQMLATWARGSEAAGAVEVMTRGLGVLRNDLRRAVVSAGRGVAENAARFRGDERSLTFATVTSLGPGREGVRMVSITIDPSGDGQALVRRGAAPAGDGYGPFTDPVMLLSGPYSYRFRYVSRKGQPSPAWTDPHAPPARIVLEIAGRNGPVFQAPLEFAVLASLSAACLANRKLPGCPNAQPDEQDIRQWAKGFGYTGGEE